MAWAPPWSSWEAARALSLQRLAWNIHIHRAGVKIHTATQTFHWVRSTVLVLMIKTVMNCETNWSLGTSNKVHYLGRQPVSAKKKKGASSRQKLAHPSFSTSPLQSTTGPPLPILSLVCRLTTKINKMVKEKSSHWSTQVLPALLNTYQRFVHGQHHCQMGSTCISLNAGLMVRQIIDKM